MTAERSIQEKLSYICRRFGLSGEPVRYRRLSGGQIHSTWYAALDDGRTVRQYVVQRINSHVFRDPAGLMNNIDCVTKHIAEKERGLDRRRRLHYYRTAEGNNYLRLGDGEHAEFWRLCDYIVNSVSFSSAELPDELLGSTGKAFGRFARQLQDLDGGRLTETIPRFHDTACRMDTLFRAAADDPLGRAEGAKRELGYIQAQRGFAASLSGRGELPVRVTHNDTRTDNILFDRDTLEPLAVIDLDTCMPGLICHDFGDMIRSAACKTEEGRDGLPVRKLDMDRFKACAGGYLSETADILTEAELDTMAMGAPVITLELAARFLTDHLTGDLYFAVDHPEQNLHRARGQLSLYQDMMLRLEEMKTVVDTISTSQRD